MYCILSVSSLSLFLDSFLLYFVHVVCCNFSSFSSFYSFPSIFSLPSPPSIPPPLLFREEEEDEEEEEEEDEEDDESHDITETTRKGFHRYFRKTGFPSNRTSSSVSFFQSCPPSISPLLDDI